jgi:mono/diheme cytochrome c family protein
MMRRFPAAPLLLLAAGFALAGAARPGSYALPDEPAIALPPGDGADLATATCSACHSLDYVTTQPRGKGAQFWKDSVAKMVTVYGAPIPPAEAERIAAYLAASYGAPSR